MILLFPKYRKFPDISEIISPFYDFPGNEKYKEMTGIDLSVSGYIGRKGEKRGEFYPGLYAVTPLQNMFYFLNFEDGWQVGGTPIITADWEADSDDRWTIPMGLGVYKTHFFGKMPIKMGAEMQWMPVNADTFGQEWNIRLTFAPVIPSFFK